MKVLFATNFVLFILQAVKSAPQSSAETSKQSNESNHTEIKLTKTTKFKANTHKSPELNKINIISKNENTTTAKADSNEEETEINDTALQVKVTDSQGFIAKAYMTIKRPIEEFLATPKVNIVLKNIGTCIVNGAMEIISYYLPAPMIPLIASAAGMMIPFEPVVMLRKRMPVTSYRRAFNKAVNSFMGTFDRYKASEEDPYMTRRFSRRFLGDHSKEKD